MNDLKLARALGVFSLGLGVADLVAPGRLADLIGVGDSPRSRMILRFVGVREIACGIGILTRSRPVGWLWGRVAGDAMDISMTSAALAGDAPRKDRVLGTLAALLGITAADLYTSVQLTRRTAEEARRGEQGGARVVKRSTTVLRPPEEVYRYWHNFTNLPRIMEHLESVQVLGDGRTHWKTKAPARMKAEWDAEIIEDRPNQLISWRSLPGSSIQNSGTVRFVRAPGDRGTEIHVELRYEPPAGPLGAVAALLFGEEPSQQLRDDLGRFKQIMETGQITLSDASAKGGGPAQPPEKAPQVQRSRQAPPTPPAEAARPPEPALP
ncbi:MAG TPA: SRPBCC family protein [Ktedonobacterales bacterium]